jgi:hypothetical protein
MVNEVPNSHPDNTVKSPDLQPLFPRAVGGVEADMLITMGIHRIDGTVVGA